MEVFFRLIEKCVIHPTIPASCALTYAPPHIVSVNPVSCPAELARAWSWTHAQNQHHKDVHSYTHISVGRYLVNFKAIGVGLLWIGRKILGDRRVLKFGEKCPSPKKYAKTLCTNKCDFLRFLFVCHAFK